LACKALFLAFFALGVLAVAPYTGPAIMKLLALSAIGVFAYAQLALLRAALPAGRPAHELRDPALRTGRKRP
jgi:hypothetical protein